MKNETFNDKKIPMKRNMSDVFIEILEITKGSKILGKEEVSKIKHNIDVEELYELNRDNNNEDDNYSKEILESIY